MHFCMKFRVVLTLLFKTQSILLAVRWPRCKFTFFFSGIAFVIQYPVVLVVPSEYIHTKHGVLSVGFLL